MTLSAAWRMDIHRIVSPALFALVNSVSNADKSFFSLATL